MSGAAPSSGAVVITGRLTMATSGGWLKKIVAKKSPDQNTDVQKTLLVDLSGVTEVDSSALAFVTSVHRLMALQNCRVEWLNVPAVIHGVASIYGADDLFVHA
jgi:ABC-type transporter Mla MlaB component